MLADLLTSFQASFDELAEAWLTMGATEFSVFAGGTSQARWPVNAQKQPPALIEKIRVNSFPIGELHLAGLQTPEAQALLKAQAGLIADLFSLERDMKAMADDLITTRDQLVALYNLTQATRNCLEVEQTLGYLADETVHLIASENAFLLLQMPGENLVWAYHRKSPQIDLQTIRVYLETIRPHQYHLLHSADVPENWPDSLRSVLIVPIQVRNAQYAALGVLNKKSSDFMSPDIKLAKAIAEFAGAYLENLHLFKENMQLTRLQTEMELARNVQLSLLPNHPPRDCGLELWAEFQPASHVSGDFYDFICSPDQLLTFLVGDISGKGMPAALLMAMTRTVIRTQTSTQPMPNPEDIIRQTNTALFREFSDTGMLATLFVGQFDPMTLQLSFANAGHSPVIYLPAGGRAQLLKADGTALGILPDSFSHNECIQLKPGDILLIGTDGLNDAIDVNGQRFGYNRLLDLTETLAHLPARAIAENLLAAINDFCQGTPQADDQTLIALKYTGEYTNK